jgi:hypothetical protein
MMKGHTNNPNGRPLKRDERSVATTYKLPQSTTDKIREHAEACGCSQSDVIVELVESYL